MLWPQRPNIISGCRLAASPVLLWFALGGHRDGIRDIGRVLPGHGGVLDRFDSFFAAATAAWAWHLIAGLSLFLVRL